MEKNDCIFCKIFRDEISPGKKVYDDTNFFAILDIHPKADGHTLIVSKKHYATMLDVPTSLGGELLDAIKQITLDLIQRKKADGVNVVSNIHEVAGQAVHHVHVHVIPRKRDDGLRSMA